MGRYAVVVTMREVAQPVRWLLAVFLAAVGLMFVADTLHRNAKEGIHEGSLESLSSDMQESIPELHLKMSGRRHRDLMELYLDRAVKEARTAVFSAERAAPDPSFVESRGRIRRAGDHNPLAAAKAASIF